jgi:serine/arginine repetitive matrix protein 2
MYNGIGVQTARGTGTSGHVMKNLSSLRPIRKEQRKIQADAGNRAGSKDTDPGITLHKALRKIEVDLIKLRDELEEEYVC